MFMEAALREGRLNTQVAKMTKFSRMNVSGVSRASLRRWAELLAHKSPQCYQRSVNGCSSYRLSPTPSLFQPFPPISGPSATRIVRHDMSLCRWWTTTTPSTFGLGLRGNRVSEFCSAIIISSSKLPPSRFAGLCEKKRVVHGRNCEPLAAGMKVFAVSDVHTDHEANMDWVRGLSSSRYREDTLICAGDVTDNLETFQITMTLFKEKFRTVFFVPGNHDLWCRRKEDHVDDSLAKLEAVNDVCNSIGVLTTPAKINGVWIVPLLSWYHQSWDRERDIEGYIIRPVCKCCTDFTACKWPLPLDNHTDSVARHFDELNVPNLQGIPNLQQADCQVITFSHFLPRFELCPEKRMLLYPNLPKMVGSDWLEARVRSVHGLRGSPTACHVFGHTHFTWDSTLDGVRYIQMPLGYPRERENRQLGDEKTLPHCIYDSEKGGLIGGPLQCKWSEYYRTHERDPDNQKLAPWVEGHYQAVSDTPPQLIQN